MAPEEMQDLVQDFTAKATAVNAVVQELPNMAAALQYVVDVCENKAPCELMADEDVEKGPNGPNGVPTRVQRIVAAPVLNDEDFATLEAACNEKGFLCIRDGLRNHLAGIDVGLTAAEMGVSSSATCLVNTDNEDARLAGMISEIHVLLLAKSKLVRTLPEIADRMRELSQAFVDADFTGFERGRVPQLAAVASMTAYDAHFPLPVAFPKESVSMGLGEVVSRQGMHQLRLAETEKYAHVTYFFNGGVEEPLPLEDRILVPSPRDVQTYDQKPAMSAREVTDKFVEAWQSGQYDLVVCNLANGDMVGHTGVLSAAVEACTVVDECVGRMAAAVEARKGRMLLIADHGNCEVMKDGQGRPQTAHTTNPVPCILLDASGREWRLHDGKLADVAPTLLRMWGIARPDVMTGMPLVEEVHVR